MTDFTKILDKAKELEAKMKESQEKIKEIRAEGVSGSNSVKITLDGEGEMQNIELSDEIMKEDKNIIEDCKTYADEDDIGSDGRSMDYHIFLTGSDNIIRRHRAEHVGNLRHTGHGLVLKGNGHRTENNLIEDCDVININGSIEFRHRSVKNNIAIDIRIVGINSSSPGGVHFRDGTSFNIVENCVIKNIKG